MGRGWWNIRCRDPAPCIVALAGKNSDGETLAISGHLPYARCTLANLTPQLASNVVVGKSGQSHAIVMHWICISRVQKCFELEYEIVIEM